MGRRAKRTPQETLQPQSRRKRLVLAGLTVILTGVVLGGGTMPVIGSADRNASVVASAITGTAPADSDTFVVAPASPTWWTKVADMAPFSMKLTGIDPASAGAPITRIGYSRSPDHVQREIPKTGPLRYVYLEAATAADADKVATWFKQADGFDNRRVYRNGQVVILAPGWVTSYAPPQQTMASVPTYKPAARQTEATMWINEEQQVPAIAVGEKNAAALTSMLHHGYGFQDGTTWMGTSGDGDTWKGSFTSGGVDQSRINFRQANSDLHATEKILGGSASAPTPSPAQAGKPATAATYQLVDPGASAILTSSSFKLRGTSEAMGNAHDGNMPPNLGDSVITSLVDVTAWNAAFSGTYSGQENVVSEAVSANSTDMTLTFTYAKQPTR